MNDLGPSERRILVALRASPRPLTHDELCEILYWDREDGGPLWARGVLNLQVYRLRRKRGLVIEHERGIGFRLTEADRQKLNARNSTVAMGEAA